MSQLDNRPTVLVVCDLTDRDLSHVITPLEGTADYLRLNSQDAIHHLQHAELLPTTIVFMQDRPGEISAAAVEEMQTFSPLSGFYVVTGNWCEGETRTGRPWPGVLRCRTDDWPRRWRELLHRQQHGLPSLSSLPATYSEEERLLAHSQNDAVAGGAALSSGWVAILSDVAENCVALADALQTAGYRVVACRVDASVLVRPVGAVIWDTPVNSASPAKISTVKARFQQTPLLVVTTFPRPHDIQAFCRSGVDAVLSKPFLLTDLLAEVRRVSESPHKIHTHPS